jgi:hypothetical protein
MNQGDDEENDPWVGSASFGVFVLDTNPQPPQRPLKDGFSGAPWPEDSAPVQKSVKKLRYLSDSWISTAGLGPHRPRAVPLPRASLVQRLGPSVYAGYGRRRRGSMQNRRRLTVLSLLEPNRIGPTITRPEPARWFHRRNAGLSDRLLSNAIHGSLDSPGSFRKNLMHAPK